MAKFIVRGRPNYNDRSTIDAGYLVLTALLVILGTVMIAHGGCQVKSDGSNYFAYLRSAVFDRDLNFHNEFARFDQAFWDTYQPKETATGHYTNFFSVGPAVLWAPFYLLAHLGVLTAGLLGVAAQPDGFSGPYLLAVNLASLFYSFAGIGLVYKLGREYFGRRVALTAAVTGWLATFITYYTVYQPYMSHAVSFFTVTLFVYYWHSTRLDRQWGQWILLGLAAGLMMLVRWQNGLMMILPAFESLALYARLSRNKNWAAVAALLKKNILFLVFALIGFLPQMIAWKIIYGSYLTVPQGAGFFRWPAPFLSEILFSSRHGLFSWTPVVYLSTVGWLFFFKRDRLFAVSGLAAFLLMAYVNSVISDWWAGWGFGMRRFDGFILFFALGLAAVLAQLKKASAKIALVLSMGALLFFSAFNWFLMDRLNQGIIHPGGPVAFNKVFGFSANGIYKYTGYPFSFPANLLFSVRYKLPPARYDTLVGGYIDDRHFYGDTIRFDQEPVLLGTGWSSGPVAGKTPPFRTMQARAVVYAPVRTVTNFDLVVHGRGIDLSSPGILINLNGHLIGEIKPQTTWNELKVKIPGKYLRPGINTLEFVNPGPGLFGVDYLKFTRLEFVPDWK